MSVFTIAANTKTAYDKLAVVLAPLNAHEEETVRDVAFGMRERPSGNSPDLDCLIAMIQRLR